MKINKRILKAVALALPTLAALPVAATWSNWSSHQDPPDFTVDTSRAQSGITYAQYSGGGLYLTWYSAGLPRPSGPWETVDSGGPEYLSFKASSYTWNEGCFSYGESRVEDTNSSSYADHVIKSSI